MPPRVRFAPSPTGFLHVGGARTALFNWLFARRHGGTFVLRIEDTDVERSSDEMVTGILDGMRWLGLDWDEGPDTGGPHGPYFQSQRLDRYRAMAERLVADEHAYYCYCTPERLNQAREQAQARGEAWTYDRACRNLSGEEIARREGERQPRAIRFKVPDGQTGFDDLVRGRIVVDHANIEDFVVLRSDGHPTYHLSVVVDDVDMAITHVVRGDDHISNTPKQVLLYDAFGQPTPKFAHVPLILGPDKKRLSKRHGATSVTEYARMGYLPEAMVNFLALLGWSPGDDREVMSHDELVAAFSLEAISGGNAVFNPEKLDWFNHQHLLRLSDDELLDRLAPLLAAAGIWRDDWRGAERAWFFKVIEPLRPRCKKLHEFVEQGRPFFGDVPEYEPDAVAKRLKEPGLAGHVAALRSAYADSAFDEASLEQALRQVAESRGVKAGALIHAARIAMTGRMVSPGLFEMLALLGRNTVLARLERLARFLGDTT